MGTGQLAKLKFSKGLYEVPFLCRLPQNPGLVRINVRREDFGLR
jgi:hypothetical protein